MYRADWHEHPRLAAEQFRHEGDSVAVVSIRGGDQEGVRPHLVCEAGELERLGRPRPRQVPRYAVADAKNLFRGITT